MTKCTSGECCDVRRGRKEIDIVLYCYVSEISNAIKVEIGYDRTYRRRVLYSFKEDGRAREEMW